MAESEGNSGIVGMIAGGVIGAVLVGGLVYFLVKPDPMKKVVTDEEYTANKVAEKQEERAILSDLEKKYGPDHPQVKQMKMELGDVPFPDTSK
jgi:hypothetical protein